MSPKDQSFQDPEPDLEIYALLDPSQQTREYQGMISSPSRSSNRGNNDRAESQDETVFVPYAQNPPMQVCYQPASVNFFANTSSLAPPVSTMFGILGCCLD